MSAPDVPKGFAIEHTIPVPINNIVDRFSFIIMFSTSWKGTVAGN